MFISLKLEETVLTFLSHRAQIKAEAHTVNTTFQMNCTLSQQPDDLAVFMTSFTLSCTGAERKGQKVQEGNNKLYFIRIQLLLATEELITD